MMRLCIIVVFARALFITVSCSSATDAMTSIAKMEEEHNVPSGAGGCGVRHVIMLLLFLSTVVAYATRVSMSIAIVAMTDTAHFDWTQSQKDVVLSSFFWGYVVLQIPGGVLVGRWGGKWLLLVAMMLNGIVNLVLPTAAMHGGYVYVITCRVLMGLAQGLIYPSVHGILGLWAPAAERGRMGSIVYAGSLLGTIVELMLAGVLAESAWGWPSVFYVAAAMSLLWALLWLMLGASSPRDSRLTSIEERRYIEVSSGSGSSDRKLPIPWKKIWTSLPFWSILIAHSGQNLGFWTLLTEMPTYMKNVLGVDMKKNGLLSSLPYAAMYLLSFVFSWAADRVNNRGILRLGTARKLFNTIAFWGPAAALLALSYLPAGNLALAVSILTVTVGLNGAHYVGFLISHIDIAPNFSSTLMGITNGCGNVFSIMAPLTVSLVIQDEASAVEWRKVFFISVAFYFLTNLFYLLFASGDIQPWNEPDQKACIEDGPKKTVKGEAKF